MSTSLWFELSATTRTWIVASLLCAAFFAEYPGVAAQAEAASPADFSCPITSDQMNAIDAAFVRDWIDVPSNLELSPDKGVNVPYLTRTFLESRAHIDALVQTLEPNGSWSDVDYTDTHAGQWLALDHFKGHLNDLVLVYVDPQSSFYQNPLLKAKILLAIDYWLTNDIQNSNWWFAKIGVPGYYLGPVLVIMKPNLTSDEAAKGAAILARCALTPQSTWWAEGGNRGFWCRTGLMYGLFTDNAPLVSRVYWSVAQELLVPPNGNTPVRPDWSEREHGHLLYSHGYGEALMVECSRLLMYAHEAGLPVDPQELWFLDRYLLDGSQWMARGNFTDYSAMGRNMTRNYLNGEFTARYLVVSARYLIAAGSPDGPALRQVIARCNGSAPQLSGNHCFYASDFMTQARPAYYVSVRVYSTRTLNAEVGFGENLRGNHLGEGNQYVVQRGDEYEGIFPVWDWNRIPGTTVDAAAMTTGIPISFVPNASTLPEADLTKPGFAVLKGERLGSTTFVGGVSDGTDGAECIDLKVLSLSAKKAWFFFDNGFAALGSGISDAAPDDVITTINQCRLTGLVNAISATGSTTVLQDGLHDLPDVRAVLHDGITYFFPTEQKVSCANEVQSGDWNSIDYNQASAPVQLPVFTLSIDHGSEPDNAADAYYVLPGLSREALVTWLGRADFQVLSNTPLLQAVKEISAGLTEAVFYAPGQLNIDSKSTLTVSYPCLVMLDQVNRKISVSDPTQSTEQIEVTFHGHIYPVNVDSGRTTSVPMISESS